MSSVNDVENGIVTTYHKNGNKHTECMYVDGKRHGLYQAWYDNGQKYTDTYYVDGNFDGLAQVWEQNGNIMMIKIYKNGKCKLLLEFENNKVVRFKHLL